MEKYNDKKSPDKMKQKKMNEKNALIQKGQTRNSKEKELKDIDRKSMKTHCKFCRREMNASSLIRHISQQENAKISMAHLSEKSNIKKGLKLGKNTMIKRFQIYLR